jgi:hypothetical protein
MKRPKMPDDQCILGTPVRWIPNSLSEKCYHVTQLRSLEELYQRPGVHNHLSEFFLLDVVLNRKRPLQGEGVTCLVERDPDAVALTSAYTDSNFEDQKDDEDCAVLAFLPGAVVLYCHREGQKPETGFENSFVPPDMSWLQLTWEKSESASGEDRLLFGPGGYIKGLTLICLQMVVLCLRGRFPGAITLINCVRMCIGEHSVLMRTVPKCRSITSVVRTSARGIRLIVVKPSSACLASSNSVQVGGRQILLLAQLLTLHQSTTAPI